MKRRREYRTALPAVGHVSASGSVAYLCWSGIDWYIWVTALSALAFNNFSPTISAAIFIAAAILYLSLKPIKALRSAFNGFTPWYYVLLALISILWSQQAELTARYMIEFAVTTGVALLIARSLSPTAFMSALLVALLIVDVSSLVDPRKAWNTGGLAMIGVFGSKNAFSEAHGILFLTAWWVLLRNGQSPFVRVLALFGVSISPLLLIAGRSADAMFSAAVAGGISFLAGRLRWASRLGRVIATLMAASIAISSILIIYPFLDEIRGQVLNLSGKDITLSGRTYLWQRAGELINQNPLLGTGFGAFWVRGNAYAEELWAHFGLSGRGGYNFHNMWYEATVQLGYPGLIMAALTVAVVSIEVIRWFVRSPNAESCFFLAYVLFIDMRTVLEVELFSQFSYTWVVFIAAWAYARDSRGFGLTWSSDTKRRSGMLANHPPLNLET